MPIDIEPGTTIFIDANIFLYKIFDHWRYAESCGDLLKDVDRGRYSGVSSVFRITTPPTRPQIPTNSTARSHFLCRKRLLGKRAGTLLKE